MRTSLRLISLFLLFCPLSCLASVVSQEEISDSVSTDSVEIKQYNFSLQVKNQEVTGICVTQFISLTEAFGTVMNEFGLTILDFEYKEGKTKLSNLPSMLDRWLIRRILQNDFSFFFKNLPSGQDFKKRSRQITFSPEGEITLLNKRFQLKYTFTPIIDEE